jgi:hypothetical protein
MTKEEAKTKCCPFFYMANAISVRGFPEIGERKKQILFQCAASDCMMWRRMKSEPEFPQGYCGLAGEAGAR